MYISLPRVISPFGNENDLFLACVNGKRSLVYESFLGKNMLVGRINFKLAEFSKNTEQRYKTRTNQILLSALLPLQSEIDKLVRIYGARRIGVVIGTTTTGVEENYEAFKGKDFDSKKIVLDKNSLSNPAEFARKFLGLKGICFGVSTACTSGVKAFACAKNFIDLGICDAVICGGVDSLNSLTLHGFNSLGVLWDQPSMPFDKDREGINIGEAAACFIMCKDEIYDYKLSAIGANCDAFHITQPNPEAREQSLLIDSLLNKAKLGNVDYINLHATGTLANDSMEAKAINLTLPNTLASGIKANIGHTLGAAGAVETAVCILAMQNSIAPMQILNELDTTLPKINLATTSIKKEIRSCLNLSFAFGGDNAAMILERV
ncbi:beta-ketoacyl synthase N-terminal-like domain-containing protein [Campylobacter sp. 9BO]|uniref:beta-ketoacyl synthase N-terminal-like domain-containing protein n=1 Tax=Campylobacter sp. 9BO TaxID=3424759 RepID=UPI003D34056F